MRDSSISTVGATALEIGSETAGNFSDINWQNIAVHSAGDAAIGIVVMDGGHVSGVSSLSRTRAPALSVCLSVCLSFCLSVFLPVCLIVCLSVCLSD